LIDVYWLEQHDADVPLQDDWLNVGEVLRLKYLCFAKRRADWRLGRWTAKRAVTRFLQLPDELRGMAEIEIRSAPSGAPEVLFANNPADITISLSHRDGTAACTVVGSKVALGCDLEMIEPHSDAFLGDYFTSEEQSLVTGGADRNLLLALLWSAKESTLKALRAGLRLDTRSVVVRPCDAFFARGGWTPLQVRHTGGRVFKGWWQQSGTLIRTLVADPSPLPPIFLQSVQCCRSECEEIAGTLRQGSATVRLA
jgi:4'-phosphopantetheinyl transferase